ncbi:phosphate-regulating neutral endopeptidase PHEX-like [Haemaphysalis longicornis]
MQLTPTVTTQGPPPTHTNAAQLQLRSWTAAAWSLIFTTAALLVISVVITAFVSTTLLADSGALSPSATRPASRPELPAAGDKLGGVLRAAPIRSTPACDSAACMDQARLLLRQINASRHPCDDFYAYVCEDWALTRPLPPGAEQMSMDTILIDGYAEILESVLQEKAASFPPLRFILDQCLHPPPTLFHSLRAMFLDTVRLRHWMTQSSSLRRPSPVEVSRKLGVAFREMGIDALFRPFVVASVNSTKRFLGLGEPSTVLLAGPIQKEEYELVRRAFAPLLGLFQNETDVDLLQFEERLCVMLSRPHLDAAALFSGVTVKVRDLPVLPNFEWTSFLQSVFDNGLRPITARTYVKLSSPDYIVQLTRGDLSRLPYELLGYLLFRVTMALSPLIEDQTTRDYLASVSYARHPEFSQVLPQAHYCLHLLERFEPNLALHMSRKSASSLLGGEGAVAECVHALRSVMLEHVEARLEPLSSALRAYLRDKISAISWEPLAPPALGDAAVRAAYVDGVYLRNSQLSTAQFFYTWIRKSQEKKFMSPMSQRSRSAAYPGWTGGFLGAESHLPPPYDRLEIPLPVFDFFLDADPRLRPLQLARAAPKVYRSLLRAMYHLAYNFENTDMDDRKIDSSAGFVHTLDELRLCLERQYTALAWTDRRLQLDASRTSWSDLWDNLALRPALDAFLFLAHRVAPDYRVSLLEHWNASQLFFLYYATNFCENSNDRFVRKMAVQGPHSPAWFRVNGPLRNSPEFALAFDCKPGTFMNPVTKCAQ